MTPSVSTNPYRHYLGVLTRRCGAVRALAYVHQDNYSASVLRHL